MRRQGFACAAGLVILAGAAAAGDRGPAVVMVDGLAVGQYRAGKWSDPSPASKLAFTGVGLGKGAGAGFSTDLVESPGNGAIVAAGRARSGVFVAGVRPTPARVTPDPGALARHAAAVRAALRGRGLRNPVQRSAYRVDLDGDGKPETVLTVASRPGLKMGSRVRRGDYSAVFVVPGTGGRSLTPALLGAYKDEAGTDLWYSEVRAIADVDGDRRPEVILSTGYQLGPGAAILAYRGGRARVVAQAMDDEP